MIQRIRKKLGEILIEAKRLQEEDIYKALVEQKKYGERLGKVLIKMGLLTEKDIIDTVSKQLGIPIVNLDEKDIPKELVKLISEDIAKNYLIIPFERRFNVLKLAMVDPLDINAMDEVTRIVRMEVDPCITTEGEMKRALEKYYGVKTIVEETLQKMKEEEATVKPEEEEEEEEEKITFESGDEEPVIRFVNSLLTQAVADSASDIHIEPGEKTLRIRMRIDGKLREIPAPPKKMFLPIVSRIKIVAGMDIAKSRIPQDGRFDIKEGTKDLGIRVSTYPTIYGEKAVLRMLDKSAALYGIDRIGFFSDDEEKIKNVIKRPYGFILSTGPTGSGKSTTLYAILNYINTPEKNIITIEDPVEYTIESISQSQVNPRAGLTFDVGLRAILRQDPDVIMVGEIRDRETATIAVHSALTGHIVLSTFHTNDAAGSATRLVEMGVEPFLVASSLTCVIAQRLLRKICPDCKEEYMPARSVLDSINIKENIPLYRGRGCPVCKYTGYKGRTGVFEVLIVDDSIRALIVDKSSSEVIKKAAKARGMMEMKDDAVRKAIAGITTLEEALNTTKID
ncbi:MAG: ATPase, T2SS/T4P/T4SS family [Proteobacteria bacterium]|nr:ATPase, T2SS/T4P/T4SS family [Pseudomonadota bacterium]